MEGNEVKMSGRNVRKWLHRKLTAGRKWEIEQKIIMTRKKSGVTIMFEKEKEIEYIFTNRSLD